ncbi:hypothetical protein [Anaerorhabdus sp.]|uniref:hypothetical protein n=1 Tax=Anaerorhabdus sp. TaxID=1872524 RepID=UPI002FC60CD2
MSKYILTEDELLELRYMERFNATKHVFHEDIHWCVDGGMVDPLYLDCMYEGLDKTIIYTIDDLLSNYMAEEMMDSIKVLEDAKKWFIGMRHYNLLGKQFYEQFKNRKVFINDPKGDLFLPKELPANEQLKGFMRNNIKELQMIANGMILACSGFISEMAVSDQQVIAVLSSAGITEDEWNSCEDETSKENIVNLLQGNLEWLRKRSE